MRKGNKRLVEPWPEAWLRLISLVGGDRHDQSSKWQVET